MHRWTFRMGHLPKPGSKGARKGQGSVAVKRSAVGNEVHFEGWKTPKDGWICSSVPGPARLPSLLKILLSFPAVDLKLLGMLQ